MTHHNKILSLMVHDIKDFPFSSCSSLIVDFRSANWLKFCILFIPGHCANHGIEEGEKTSSEKKRWTPKRSFSLLNTASTSRTPVPLHQIISLVSITSPRSFRPHKVSVSPSFVEFDMTDSGYGWVPAPSNLKSLDVLESYLFDN